MEKKGNQKEKEELVKALVETKERLVKMQEDIEQFVDSVLACADITEQKRLEVRSAIVEVFASAGADLLPVRSRLESIVVLDKPVAFCRRVNSPDRAMMDTRCQVVLPLDPGMPEPNLKFYIAHELAHAALVHYLIPGPLGTKAGALHEAEADILAAAWGFPVPKPPEVKEPGK